MIKKNHSFWRHRHVVNLHGNGQLGRERFFKDGKEQYEFLFDEKGKRTN